ncbi:hypothetical protein D3C85_1867250 [compost metagenome]
MAPIPSPMTTTTGTAMVTGATTRPARPIRASTSAVKIGPRRSGKRPITSDTMIPAATSAPVMPLSR